MKQPPQFVEKLQNTGIPEGTPVRLECRVVGLPPPVIFWKKDNDSIPCTKDRVKSVTYCYYTQYSHYRTNDNFGVLTLFCLISACIRMPLVMFAF